MRACFSWVDFVAVTPGLDSSKQEETVGVLAVQGCINSTAKAVKAEDQGQREMARARTAWMLLKSCMLGCVVGGRFVRLGWEGRS